MTNKPEESDLEQEEQPFVSHLLELRDRLLKVVLSILVVFLGLVYFAREIYDVLARPFASRLLPGTSMQAIDPTSPVFAPLKLTLWVSVFLAMPYILYQIWMFVAPGLYRHERKMLAPILASSIVLFYAGTAFAYFVVFPLVANFFIAFAPETIQVSPDIARYLDFALAVFFAFGLAFEVPVATIVLVWAGAVTPQKLSKARPYIIVGAFVIGMMLTPPDVISQTLLALPMWLLFELGLLLSRYYVRTPAERAEDEGGEETASAVSESADTSAGGGSSPEPESDYRPLSDEEMDSELDRIDEEMDRLDGEDRDDDSDDDEDDGPRR